MDADAEIVEPASSPRRSRMTSGNPMREQGTVIDWELRTDAFPKRSLATGKATDEPRLLDRNAFGQVARPVDIAAS